MSRVRIAFVCDHKDCSPPFRQFYASEPDEPPRCPDHGRMKRQANMPYETPDVNAPLGKPKTVRARRKKST